MGQGELGREADGMCRHVNSAVVYLDNNATTRPAPEVVEAMVSALTAAWHNPSSVHRAGQEARARVELARQAVAALIGAKPKEITFTSGGTEAIDLAVRGSILATGRRVLVTSPVEHAAIRDLAESLKEREGVEVRWAAVDGRGVVSLDSLRKVVDASVGVVSIQWANNETGVVQPVEEIGKLCRERGVVFHCDGTQWVGKMEAGTGDAGTRGRGDAERGTLSAWCDLLTFSAHKFHGPKGVGVLWARQGVRLVPRLSGVQEKGRRGGTENVPGIVGAGVAARLAAAWLRDPGERDRLARLRDRLEELVVRGAPDARVNSVGGERLWNTTNIGFPRLEAEALLLMLSERGVCASAGAACSSGSLDPSPVLLAMGVPPEVAHGSLRFSLSRETTEAEIEEAAGIVVECVTRLGASTAAVG